MGANVGTFSPTHGSSFIFTKRKRTIRSRIEFIDFDRIQCLTIVSIEDFILLEKSMINIKHLTIDRKITTKNIENIRNYRFESIRTLNIRLSDDYI